jgi:hypothetical protein
VVYVKTDTGYNKTADDRLKRITKGSNGIFLLNKNSLEIEGEIKLENWLQPRGMCVDVEENLFTTAFKLDENKFISTCRYLFLFNRTCQLLREFKLDGFTLIEGFLFKENKIYTTEYSNKIIIIELK